MHPPSSAIDTSMKIKWLERWNGPPTLCEALKFLKPKFNNIEFSKWLHKSTWWAHVIIFSYIIFGSFIFFASYFFYFFQSLKKYWPLFYIWQLAIKTEKLFNATMANLDVSINYFLDNMYPFLLFFIMWRQYACHYGMLHFFVSLL